MDVFPKFIIETDDEIGDALIISKCTYHRQLVTDYKKVKGGGWWELDRENSVFIFYGSSEDFGKANQEDIANCVRNNKVFSNKSLFRNISKDFTFKYKDANGVVFDLMK